MTVKKLSIDEIPAWLELYGELECDDVGNNVQTSRKVYETIVYNDDYLILVVKDNDALIGTAMGVCCKTPVMAGTNFLVVENVVVAESAKRKGVGRLLFEALDRFAAEKDCSYAILCSSTFRTGAHAFYEKMGYTDDVKGFRKLY